MARALQADGLLANGSTINPVEFLPGSAQNNSKTHVKEED